ncbi:MAG: AAA family ATPase [Deltaproteobacteria bacterium]|nr:AAA family ATPase [Deltaproteobacteria bacterium]
MARTLRLESYTPEAKSAVASAQQLADDRDHPEVEAIHLLHKLAERDLGTAAALKKMAVAPTDVVAEAEVVLRKLPVVRGSVAFLSPRLQELLGRAEVEAARDSGGKVQTRHLLLAIGQEARGPAADLLRSFDLNVQQIREALGQAPAGSSEAGGSVDPLERFGRDLTRMAADGRFDPIVGRDAELRRVMQVLSRRFKNNPILIGGPGVGKTAIVEALAQRLVSGDVPAGLKGKRLVSLDLGAILAGAKLRGELEDRIKSMLTAIRDSGGEVLLFIDEIHTLVGAGGGSGSVGAADLLKPALARGELRCIGVTTPDEHRRYFEKDAALARRFQPINVDEPSVTEAIQILRGVVEKYEIHHGIKISDPAVVAAVSLSSRYLTDRHLPDKAIDLMDEAASKVRIEIDSVPEEIDALERRVLMIQMELRSLVDEEDRESKATVARLEAELADIKPKAEGRRAAWEKELGGLALVQEARAELDAARREQQVAEREGDLGRASELRFGVLPELEERVARLGAEAHAPGTKPILRESVSEQDVAKVVEEWTGIPAAKMMQREAEKLLAMEDKLRERVVGQDDALKAVGKAVRRGRVGLRDPGKPIGSFLFLGPTGVGKTELAKALAEFMFDDEASLTRLDMSEFMERHMAARLVGAPPGYVDSDEGGYLTEAVRRRPYSVVLFDEVEKGHNDVFNLLLQVLDDGRLTDGRGRLVNFSNTVIIMTSNIGGQMILDFEGDMEALRERMDGELRKHFRPEFLNRIDDVIVFNRLRKEDLHGIVNIQLERLGRLLAERDLGLDLTEKARKRLVERGYDPAFGARPLKRVLLKEVQDPLAEEILRGGYAAGDVVRIDEGPDGFRFERRIRTG